MKFALSTRWNARRHTHGAALVDEILALGFSGVELGYDFRRDLAEGVLQRVREGAVRVTSVHSFCPVPMGVPRGHPELWTLVHPEPEVRRKAVEHLRATAIFAAEMGAGAMVVHGGYAAMRPLTPRLIRLLARGREGSWWWNRTWNALDRRRTRRVPAALDDLRRGLDKLLPDLERLNVTLALENLPSLEAVPSEIETLDLLAAYPSPRIAAWYDFGHGQIRENLGFVNAARLLERIAPRLAGFHIHDVAPPATDHLPPGRGAVEYARFRDVVRGAGKLPLVIEPQRDASAGDLRSGMDYLRTVWSGTAPG